MLNAWGKFGGVQKLGLGSLLCTSLYATLVGCDPLTVMEESDPSKLSVMYSGCHTVQEGPLCELPKLNGNDTTASLTLHVELQDIPTIVIRSSEGETIWKSTKCSAETCVKTEAGHRIVLAVAASTQEVMVKSPNPDISDWALSIIDYQERPTVMSDAVALERNSKRDEALQLLETALPTLAPHWQAEAMSHVARMYKRLGKADEALQSFEQSMDLHLQTGGLSHYVKDGTAAVHTLIMDAGMKLNEARDLASSLRGILPRHYESQHFYHWASLFAANKAHAHQDTLYHGERGIRLAKQMDKPKFEKFLLPFFTHALQKLGRFDDAIKTLKEKTDDAKTPKCVDAENLNTLGFIRWFAFQARSETDLTSLEIAKENFLDAIKVASQHCNEGHNRHEQTNGRINLALAFLSLDDLEQATKALDQIPSDGIRQFHSEWLLQTRAEIALASKRPQSALQWLTKLTPADGATPSPYLELRTLLGKARAHAQLGNFHDAHQVWRNAQTIINQEGILVPIHDGREIFLAQYQNATRDYVQTALDNGKVSLALEAVREAHAQLLQSVQWQDRIQSLSEAERIQWQTNLGYFQNLRKELEALRKSSWSIPNSLKAAHQAKLTATEQRTAVALHQTLHDLGFAPRSTSRDHYLEPGELELTYFNGRNGWLCFIRSVNGIDAVELGKLSINSTPQSLSRFLLDPVASELQNATAVNVTATGKLSDVDFHSLEFNGRPLIEQLPLTYQVNIASNAPSVHTPQLKETLVVSDPSGNLSQARHEANYAQEVLSKISEAPAEILHGQSVTVESLQAKLPQVNFLHYAGHGVFDEERSSRSALLLANDTRLDVKDIVALPKVPEIVVLSACETAKTHTAGLSNQLGIAQAFLSAGSSMVLAAKRPVNDKIGNHLMMKFYSSLDAGHDIAVALQQAQIETMKTFPESDWATYRLITRN